MSPKPTSAYRPALNALGNLSQVRAPKMSAPRAVGGRLAEQGPLSLGTRRN
jgi:hypothetical protein